MALDQPGSYAPGSQGYGTGPAGKAKPGNQQGPRKAPPFRLRSGIPVIPSSNGKRGNINRGRLGKRGR